MIVVLSLEANTSLYLITLKVKVPHSYCTRKNTLYTNKFELGNLKKKKKIKR